MLNPPKKLTTSEKVSRRFALHAELVIFVAGLVLGFTFGKL